MARRATAIKQEKANSDGVVLLLDAGSTLVGAWEASRSLGKVTVESMNRMGYDAMTVGRMDLAIGLEAIRQRQQEAKFPFLSANIVNEESGELLFDPYVILERQGVRIGIIGLSEEQAIQVPLLKVKTKVLDPVETTRDLMSELRDQVHLLIVLSHLGLDADMALAQAVPGIDIIIGGNTRKLMSEPQRVGNTIIVQQGYRGEWMGKLTASFDAQGVPTEYAEKVITLTEAYADDPDLAALVQEYKELYPRPTPVPTPTPAGEKPAYPTPAAPTSAPTDQQQSYPTPQPTK